ncbi:MAG: hypothetical protein HFH38_06355 [Lachnospiraceae bacterium]|nr:hypothetical protein [Lachnospiraceae bacterium]
MDLTFGNLGADYMIQQIMMPMEEGGTAFWTDPLYHFYPELDKAHAQSLPLPERKRYIESTLREAYARLEAAINEKAAFHEEKYFDVFYLNSERGAIGSSIHEISSINPYFPREEGGCIYPYFFDMEAGGGLVLDRLHQMYQEQPIKTFMENSYAYCKKYEPEIRKHIQEAEGGDWT